MGADLLLFYLPHANTRKKGRRAEFLELVNHLPDDDLKDVPVFTDVPTVGGRQTLIGCFDELKDLADARDVAVIRPYRNMPPLMITGGMSWGDLPTESSRVLSVLVGVPGLYAVFERWAVEDEREQRQRRPSKRNTPNPGDRQ